MLWFYFQQLIFSQLNLLFNFLDSIFAHTLYQLYTEYIMMPMGYVKYYYTKQFGICRQVIWPAVPNAPHW